MKKAIQPPKESRVKQSLLGLYGIIGVALSTFGPFKVPFAESHAKEYWRHALFGIILVLALITGVVSLALYLFDANYFKSQMVDYVKTHNQRDLTLEGDIKVTFFPKLGLDAGKMSLSQRNSGKNFASIDNARFYVAWWPLFLKQLQIEHVDLNGVHANIVRYKNCSTNLDDLFTRDGSQNDIKLDIDSMRFKNSSINFTDEPTGLVLFMHDMDIETGRLTDSTPGKITANFRLESTKPRIDTKVKLGSHLLFELKANHYEFANFEIEMEGESAGINNLALNLQGTFNSYPAEGRATLDKFIASAKGKLENRKLDAKLDIPKMQLIKNKLSGNTLAFNASLLQEDENLNATLEIPAFDMTDKKLQSENVTANIDFFKTGRTLQGKLSSPLTFDFDTLQMQLPVITSSMSGSHPLLSSKLNANISGNMLANFSEPNIKLNLKTKIDDSNFVSSVSVQSFTHPAYLFDVAVNTLDLDRYLASDWYKRFQDDKLPFDFSGLKDLNLHGKFRSNEFKLSKLKFSNLLADIKIEQSTLQIEPFNARLYNGTVTGSLSISASDIPKLALKQKLTGVQFNALLADIIPGEAKLTGKGNLNLDLNASGENMGALRKSLNGSASLAMGRGSLAGINIADSLLAGKNQLGIKDSERTENIKFTETTPFTELKATFDFNEGKASNSDFLLRSALLNSKGEGDITLDSGQLNFHINATVAANLKRSNSGELAELKGINIPIRVSGPYATPTISLELGNASGGSMASLFRATTSKDVEKPVNGKKSTKSNTKRQVVK
jgi:AsmA protein